MESEENALKKPKQEVTSMETDAPKTEAKPETSVPPLSFENDSGYYELFALVTHKGRYADSGHYIAWVKDDSKPKEPEPKDVKPGKKQKEEDIWIKFDDDTVSLVNTDEILKLSGKGGADWHMAYLAFYRTKKFTDI
jgi:ubiquitin carboxyl-terminal hydrolase 14